MKEEKGSLETRDLLQQAHACSDKPVDIQDAPFLTCYDKRSLAVTRNSSPTDSCRGRVIGINNIVSYVPPTAVVKLLQYSGLGSNTGMGFHPINDLHQCLKMVRLLFGFSDLFKNRGVCWSLVICNCLK